MTPKINNIRILTWRGHPTLPLIFCVLGLVLLVYGIITFDFKSAIMGAFLFLAFLTPLLHVTRKHVKLRIVQRLCLFTLGVLGYYVFSLTLWGIIILLVGVAALADIIYSVILKKSPSDP